LKTVQDVIYSAVWGFKAVSNLFQALGCGALSILEEETEKGTKAHNNKKRKKR
jgi:hypothetical protein